MATIMSTGGSTSQHSWCLADFNAFMFYTAVHVAVRALPDRLAAGVWACQVGLCQILDARCQMVDSPRTQHTGQSMDSWAHAGTLRFSAQCSRCLSNAPTACRNVPVCGTLLQAVILSDASFNSRAAACQTELCKLEQFLSPS